MASDSTRWTVIRGAAEGGADHRAEFVRRYAAVVRAYLGSRWRHTPLTADIDDAVQDVFVDCFKAEGALERVREDTPSGFRGYLYGVVRNVARRAEEKRRTRKERHRSGVDVERIEAADTSLSEVFDRAWARAVIRQAGDLQANRAQETGEAAVKRVELLRLRFGEGLPIREIAQRWDEDPTKVHTQYAQARKEFKDALTCVVQEHHPARSVGAECERLLRLFKV